MQTAILLKFFIIIFGTKHMMYEGCLVSNRRLLAIGGGREEGNRSCTDKRRRSCGVEQ